MKIYATHAPSTVSLAVIAALSVGTANAASTTAVTTTASPVSMTNNCAGGGTRVLTGTYDATTGKVETSAVYTSCATRGGDKISGSLGTTGVLKATATGFDVNIVSTVDTVVTRSDNSQVLRKCTTTKVGTFASASSTFTGKTSISNCSTEGMVLEHENVIEHILRAATGVDDDGGLNAPGRLSIPSWIENIIKKLPPILHPPVVPPGLQKRGG